MSEEFNDQLQVLMKKAMLDFSGYKENIFALTHSYCMSVIDMHNELLKFDQNRDGRCNMLPKKSDLLFWINI